MDPRRFLADLEAKPVSLERLAIRLETDDPAIAVPTDVDRVVMLGMGSSRYAAQVAALRLRSAGIDAVAEYASSTIGHPPDPRTLVVAISATGESRETLRALERYAGRSPVVAITNDPHSSAATMADHVIDLAAGEETGGVACRTFQHTGLVLRHVEARLTGQLADTPGLCRRVAAATADLLTRREDWLPGVLDALDGRHGVYVLAPAERLSSAEQSALMIREGPRRPADACETGDWAHVDVYLAKTLDYRALLYAGSTWDGQAMDWLRRRGSTVVAVGADVPAATLAVRYEGDDAPDVALYTEIIVGELVAAAWWQHAEPG